MNVTSQQIRRAFLQYYKSQNHAVIPSSPVVPHDDPTLLFTNAGMNQFKDLFLGKAKRDYTRAATTQKCIRVGGKHNDLENVGHTTRHLTFFEMLGNFSFGDYFKKEAIQFAWDVVTQVFQFDPEKVWVSVYKEDDEAHALWEKHISASKIVRFGEKENFWAMGDTGPCGPCSELLFDRGETYGSARNPTEDASGERFLEFWNLVFMQFSRDISGKMEPLPKQSIDTGAGLERVVSLKMGVDTVFQTDVLRGLVSQVEKVSGRKYDKQDEKLAPAFHVIADHIRSLSFAIADGAQPSNTDRGYVLRKILRRAVRYGRMLGMQKPFMADVLPQLVTTMGEDFPELHASRDRIAEILTLEEEAFLRTLTRGGQLLSQVIERSHKTSEQISGEDAFKLKDTYGFPLEEILLIAKDEALSVHLEQFEKLEEEAKEKSRKAHKTTTQQFSANFFEEFAKSTKESEFTGYSSLESASRIEAIVIDGQFADRLEAGQEALIILDKTPFYAEMGGQVGDRGTIDKGHASFEVYDTTNPYAGVIAHIGKMGSGILHKGDAVTASIGGERRKEIEINHTATHLLHWALQQVLGSHIKQAGSLVEDRRLRFDFSHHKPLSAIELRTIEDLVNEKIRSDAHVKTYELAFEEAQKKPEIKQFFGEKYGDKVRVVDIDFSKELCGGTHVKQLGVIGLFKIGKESSIAAGVRRIEAVTGKYAEQLVQQQEDLLQNIGAALKSTPAAALERIGQLVEENKKLSADLKTLRREKLKTLAIECLAKKEHSGHIAWIAEIVDVEPEDLNGFAEELLHKLKSGVVALGIRLGDRCQLLVTVSADMVQKNILASQLVKEAAPLIEGGGGGKQMIAQAGGKKPAGLSDALEKIRNLLRQSA